jgi:hypothetical protein
MIIGGTEAMPEYTIVFDGFRAYAVEVRDIGSFRSVRRFQTKSEALAWIVEQQAYDPDESGKQFSERRLGERPTQRETHSTSPVLVGGRILWPWSADGGTRREPGL